MTDDCPVTHPEAPVRTGPALGVQTASCISLPRCFEVNPKQDILPINISACTAGSRLLKTPAPSVAPTNEHVSSVLPGPLQPCSGSGSHPLCAGDLTVPGLQACCLPPCFCVVCVYTHVRVPVRKQMHFTSPHCCHNRRFSTILRSPYNGLFSRLGHSLWR